MRIRRAIITRLKADAAVAAIVSDRITAEWAEDELEAPYISVGVIAHSHVDGLAGVPFEVDDVRLEINMWTVSEAQRGLLWAAVFDAVHNLHHVTEDGVTVLSVRVQRTADVLEPPMSSGRPILRCRAELRIRGRVAA